MVAHLIVCIRCSVFYLSSTKRRKAFSTQNSYEGAEMHMAANRRQFAYHTTDGDNYPDDGGKNG